MVAGPVISLVWGIATKTDAAKLVAASSVPGASVVVDEAKAAPAVVAVAQDPKVAGVTTLTNKP